jgi:hypothetical protein
LALSAAPALAAAPAVSKPGANTIDGAALLSAARVSNRANQCAFRAGADWRKEVRPGRLGKRPRTVQARQGNPNAPERRTAHLAATGSSREGPEPDPAAWSLPGWDPLAMAPGGMKPAGLGSAAMAPGGMKPAGLGSGGMGNLPEWTSTAADFFRKFSGRPSNRETRWRAERRRARAHRR